MNRIARFLEALQTSRQLEADRVIRRYRHLVEEARAHERRHAIEAAGYSVGRASQTPFTSAELCTTV